MKKRGRRKKRIVTRIALVALCAAVTASVAGCGNRTSSDAAADTAAAVSYASWDIMPEEEALPASASADASGEAELIDEEYGSKLIRTIDMTAETTEFDALIATLRSRADEMDGYVERSDVSSPGENENRRAYLTIRVPAERLDEFLSVVGDNANVLYTGESVEDVTLRYVDLEAHISELEAEREALESMLDEAQSVEDLIAIRSQLTQIRYEIESYTSQRNILANQIDYSTVYLTIDEVDRETSAAAATFGKSLGTRIRDNFYRLGRGLRNFAIGFLGVLPVILVVAAVIVVVLILICVGVRHRRRKKDRREELMEDQEDSDL